MFTRDAPPAAASRLAHTILSVTPPIQIHCLLSVSVTMGLAVSAALLNNVDGTRLLQWFAYRGFVLAAYGVVSICLGWFLPDSPYYTDLCVPYLCQTQTVCSRLMCVLWLSQLGEDSRCIIGVIRSNDDGG